MDGGMSQSAITLRTRRNQSPGFQHEVLRFQIAKLQILSKFSYKCCHSSSVTTSASVHSVSNTPEKIKADTVNAVFATRSLYLLR